MKNVKFIFSIGFLLYFHILFSQRLNQVLISGSDIGYTQQIDFLTSPPSIKPFKSSLTFDGNIFYVTDDKDSLYLYGNGCSFADELGKIVLHIDLFDVGFDTSYCQDGLVGGQAMLVLPQKNDQLVIINKHLHREIGSNYIDYYGLKLRIGIIDDFFNYNIIDEIVDTFEAANFAACKKSDGAGG